MENSPENLEIQENQPEKRRRGRPRLHPEQEKKPKNTGRGRPPKNREINSAENQENPAGPVVAVPEPVKRRRGRPRSADNAPDLEGEPEPTRLGIPGARPWRLPPGVEDAIESAPLRVEAAAPPVEPEPAAVAPEPAAAPPPTVTQAVPLGVSAPVFDCTAEEVLGVEMGDAVEDAPAEGPERPRRAFLPEHVRQFIVILLACGETPPAVATAVKERYGYIVSRDLVNRHDPTHSYGQALRPDYKQLFAKARHEYQTTIMRVGVATSAYRLTKYQHILNAAMERGAYKLAMQALEGAAREAGGKHVNNRKSDTDDKRAALANLLKVSPDQLPAIQKLVDQFAPARESVGGAAGTEYVVDMVPVPAKVAP